MKNKKNIKGQVSIEFTFIVSIVALFFVVSLVLIYGVISDTTSLNQKHSLQMLGNIIQDEVYIARVVEDNYMREFELPRTIDGRDYEISIKDYNPYYSNYSEITLKYTDAPLTEFSHHVVFLYETHVDSLIQGKNIIVKQDDELKIYKDVRP